VVHDNNGNLTNDGTFTYTYNPRNQLTLVEQGTQTLGAFTYDGLGRRVVRTIDSTTTKPAYDGWNLVQERGSDGSVSADYLNGLGLDQPFLRTAGSSTDFYLSDALGSIVGLAFSTGTVPTTYTYEPYGKAAGSGTSSASFLGFTGRENDSTGTLSLYNYRARYYSPSFGRFISEDPLAFPGGPDPDLYSYVGNDPVSLRDPFGLDPGNGCGFLGFGCLAGLFASFFSFLGEVGQCLKYAVSCILDDIIHRIIIPAAAAGALMGMAVNIAVTGCGATAVWTGGVGCAIAIAAGTAVFVSTGVITYGYYRELWRKRDTLFDYNDCDEGSVFICVRP
jgi:RHS repeat-associated protein